MAHAVPGGPRKAEYVPAGYKRTEVGVIPEDWDRARVGDVARVKGGKRLPSGFVLVDTPTPYPYLRVTDMYPGGVTQAEIRYVPEKAFPAIRNYRIYSDDIFISVAGTLGIVGVVPPNLSGANLTENADCITNIRCNRDYLMHWLMSSPIQEIIESIRTVGAQPKLALGRIAALGIAIPRDSDEQCAIAEALSDVDGLLEALDALIAKKRTVKQATMQQLLTGKTRLPGCGRGKWMPRRLGHHVTFLRNGTNSRSELTSDGPVKYLHYGDIHASSGVYLDPRTTTMPAVPPECAASLDRLENGDLVMVDASEDLEGVGTSVEVKALRNLQLVAGLHTIAARFDKSVLADGFKAYLQFCPELRAHLRRLAAGTKVYATNRAHIASAEIRLPDLDEQGAIATVLSDMDTPRSPRWNGVATRPERNQAGHDAAASHRSGAAGQDRE